MTGTVRGVDPSLEQAIRSSDIAAGYAALINFASEPTISSSHLWVDNGLENDTRLTITKFPLRHEFKAQVHRWKPFVQATLARLVMDQTYDVFDGQESVEPTWSAYSFAVGGGVRIPLSPHWSLLPAFDLGYTRLNNTVHYSGDRGNIGLKPLLDGILFNWSADAWLSNVHLALRYENSFKKLDVTTTVSGTASRIESFNSTSSFQEFGETLGTMHFKADGTYPLGISFKGNPLSVVGHVGNTTMVGDKRDELGFTSVNETGISFEMGLGQYDLPLSKLGIGAMGLWGKNVYGWALIFRYAF